MKRIVIIGGGVIGLCTAYYCLRRGHAVTVLERGSPEHDSCSLGNAGMIVPSHFVPLAAPGMIAYGLRTMWNPESPFHLKPRLDPELLDWGMKFIRAATPERVALAAPVLRDLNLASRAEFVALADALPDKFALVQAGLLMLCRDPHTLDEEAAMARRALELGVPAEVLSADETAKLDPGARMDVAGSVYFPKDAHLSPGDFVRALTNALLAGGADFKWRHEVVGWKTNGHRITGVETLDERIVEGDEFLIAGGAWSPEIAKALGVRLPMRAGKGYSLTLREPRELPRLCSILTEARVAVTPMGGSLRVGGTMEIGGLDNAINTARVRGIIKSFVRYFPLFNEDDFTDIVPWVGHRPCSPDGLPYMGRHPRFANLSLATGHAMMGLSLAPVTGRLMSELLSDLEPSMDLSLLAPDRFVDQ